MSVIATTAGVSEVLAAVDVSLEFQGVRALDQVSFSIREGEICALIGPNGAGKSSLLNVLNGIYQPSDGFIRAQDQALRAPSPQRVARQGIARTFQHLGLFPGMTVLENVLTGRALKHQAHWMVQALGLPAARRAEISQTRSADAVLEFVGIAPWRNVPVSELSYGLQKKVDLARALASEPSILLLDEPMAGLNKVDKEEMAQLITRINREHKVTVVIIEHDIGVVMGLSDHIIVLDHGQKIGDGSPAQVRANPAVIEAYLGTGEGTEEHKGKVDAPVARPQPAVAL
uniref:ABC transporter ATP-binding protein n=1 Tax=Marinobacter nauticus TaxID=2743 RepID=A0A455WD53_MARNT|nr:ABC transporter ATP-binding protein [Marinobacter nauticus]